jgi:hypothetical protein
MAPAYSTASWEQEASCGARGRSALPTACSHPSPTPANEFNLLQATFPGVAIGVSIGNFITPEAKGTDARFASESKPWSVERPTVTRCPAPPGMEAMTYAICPSPVGATP